MTTKKRMFMQSTLAMLVAGGMLWHTLTHGAGDLAKGTGELDEVWATEQNGNLNGGSNTGHGSIVVFNAINMSVKTIIDTDGTDTKTCLAGQTPPNCVKITRPHTVQFSRDYKYAITIGTLSTSMSIFNAETKQLLQNFPVAPGTSPHTASASPDDTRIFASGIGGSKPFVQEFPRDFSNAAAPYSPGKFLDLTDVTAVAALADDSADAAKILSSTAVPKPMFAVCPGYSIDGKDLYVRLTRGGLVIFDISKPKNGFYAISKVMDSSVFPINGCGFLLNDSADKLYLDSGLEHRSDIHILDVSQVTDPANPRYGRVRNELIKTIHTSGDGTTSPLGVCQLQFGVNCNDLHSMHFNQSGNELWAYSRTESNIVVLNTSCDQSEGAGCLNVKEVFNLGPAFRSPDLSSLNRKDKLVYVSMRGPDPQPTAAHPIAGSGTPGLAVIDLNTRQLINVFVLRQAAPPCTFTAGPTNGFECDDPHGVGYRFVPPPKHLSPTRLVGGM